MRKISELGLKKTYESNSELVLALNMIPALSFVPESKVEIGFDLAQSGTSGLILVFNIFWNPKRAWSCIDIKCSSKYADFYAFPFAMRPSGANANAQLILPGEKIN